MYVNISAIPTKYVRSWGTSTMLSTPTGYGAWIATILCRSLTALNLLAAIRRDFIRALPESSGRSINCRQRGRPLLFGGPGALQIANISIRPLER